MPFLSRIWINPRRQAARRLLGDPHAMKATIYQAIPNQPVQERVLWRVDGDDRFRPALFVLSQTRPSFEHLVEQAGWPSADEPQAQSRDLADLLGQLEAGDRYAFRLTANPTEATRRPDRLTASQRERPDRSHRVGHRTVAHQLRWLLERTNGWGFAIPPVEVAGPDGEEVADVAVVERRRLSFQRKGSGRVTLQVVTYQGRLEITDADRFQRQIQAGFGRAKAFGCGLLTLAPLVVD